MCSTKGNLSQTCNQRGRRVFFINGEKQKLCGVGWLLLSLVTGSSFVSLLISQNHSRIWVKRCHAFSHEQDTIWGFFSGLKGFCACFCLSLLIFFQTPLTAHHRCLYFCFGCGFDVRTTGDRLKSVGADYC